MNTDQIIVDFQEKLGIEYEKDSIRLVRKYIKARDVVLEGGTALGIVTAEIAKIASFVYTFEPNPLVNLDLKNSWFFQGALGSKNMLSDFKVGNEFWNSTLVGDPHWGGVAEVRKVLVYDTNELISYFRPTVLLLDVEGSEIEILNNLKESSTLDLIIAEIHPWKGQDFLAEQVLVNKGWKVLEEIKSEKPDTEGHIVYGRNRS